MSASSPLLWYSFEAADVSGTALRNLATNSWDATLVNSAAITTSNYKVGSSALYQNGTTGNGYVNVNSAVTINTSGMSIGLWVRNDDARVDAALFSFGYLVVRQLSSTCALTVTSYDQTWQTTQSVAGGVWNHICLTIRYDTSASSLFSLYVNGKLHSSTSQRYPPFGNISSYNKIGLRNDGYNPFNGNIDDFRLYQKTLSLSEIQSIYTSTGGTFNNNVALYSSFVFTPRSQIILSTSGYKFGTHSMYSNNTGYLTVSSIPSTNMSDNWTVECWFNTSLGNPLSQVVWNFTGLAQTSCYCGLYNGQVMFILGSDNSRNITDQSPRQNYTTNQWNHMALVHSGTSYMGYLNGTRFLNVSSSLVIPATIFQKVNIGSWTGAQWMYGYIDEFRVSSTARYTGSSFTVPSSAFKSDSNTVCLLHFDGTYEGYSGAEPTGIQSTGVLIGGRPSRRKNEALSMPLTNYNGNHIIQAQTDKTNVDSFSMSAEDLTFNSSSGYSYAATTYSKATVSQFTITASDSSGSSVSDFSGNEISLTLSLPNASPNDSLTIYKLSTSGSSTSIMDPQPSGYPVTLTYSAGYWTGSLTSLSTVAVISASSSYSYNFDGLTNGSTYTFKVAAFNSAGTGSYSSSTSSVTPYTLPGTPTNVSATAVTNSTTASLTWTAPSNNGSSITGYSVIATDASGNTSTQSTGSSSASYTFTGLTVARAYTFTVAATNAAGTGSYSSSSNSITPYTAPGAPTIGTPSISASSTSATVNWTAPTSTGGSAITGYSIVSSPATTTQSAGSSATSMTFTGLTYGTSYTFTVAAVNAIGTGTYSSSSSSITPYTTPGTPTNVSGSSTASSTTVTLAWTAPSNRGSAITGYSVIATDASGATTTKSTGSTSASYSFTGLTYAVAYTFTVAAINAVGTGSYSSSSSSITPYTTPGSPTTSDANVSGTVAVVTWSAPSANGRSITSYTVRATDSSGNATTNSTGSSSTSYTFTGLTSGRAYTFTVAATNLAGTGSYGSASTPGTPTIGTPSVTAASTSATVNWTAPTTNGGSTILGYYVVSSPATTTQTVTDASATTMSFTGLSYGTSYTFTVAAYNSIGTGSYSSSSESVMPYATPFAPTIGTASISTKTTTATITWTAPTNNGGSTILGYYVVSDPATTTQTASASASSISFTGLSYGTSYTFTVAGYNTYGTGTYSSSSNSITPTGVPGTPTIGTASVDANTKYVTVNWTAPTVTNGSAITGYRITSSPATYIKTTTDASATSFSFGELTYGTSYLFYVAAINSVGTGSNSSGSNTVTPYTKPDAPTIGSASISYSSTAATITWTAPSTNGSDILGYYIKSSPTTSTISADASSNSVSFTGLSYGTSYTFSVAAYNAAGTSSYSSNTASITPRTTPGTPTIGTANASGTSATVRWTAPTSTGGSTILGYYVVSSPATTTQSGSGTSMTFTGLTLGTSYTFTVAAYNIAGTGSYSSSSNSVTAATTPDTPTIGTATMTSGTTTATITWTEPASSNGSSITGYSVKATSTSGTTITKSTGSTDTSYNFTGLSYGVTYTFTVAAINSVGTGSYSSSSNSVQSTSTPNAPTIGTVSISVDKLETTVSWTAPSDNGGLDILGYYITSSPATSTFTADASSNSVTFTGLSYWTSYTFTVAAYNSAGTGTSSSASNSITPYFFRASTTITADLPVITTEDVKTVEMSIGTTSEEVETFDITINSDTLVTATNGFDYVNDPIYSDSIVMTASFLAFTSSGTKITDFTSTPIEATLDIPHANTSSTLLLYKLNDNGTIMVPQPDGYPRPFSYDSENENWSGTLTAFSDYALIDVGYGSSTAGAGGDPHIRTVYGELTLLPNNWRRVRLYEKDDIEVIAKCKLAPVSLLEGMHVYEGGQTKYITENFRKQWLAENLTFMNELEIHRNGKISMLVDLFTGRIKKNDKTFAIKDSKQPWGLRSVTTGDCFPPVKYVSFDVILNTMGDRIAVHVDPFWDEVNAVTFHSSEDDFGECVGEFFTHSPDNRLTNKRSIRN